MTVLLILSFDDTPQYNIKAADLLEKHGLKACFNLDPDGLGRELNEEDVKGISQHHEVGGHTVTYCNLLELDQERTAWELNMSKQRLEALLKKRIESFVYPYGLFDEEIKNLLPFVNYSSGQTTEPFHTSLGDDVYQIGVTLWASPHLYRRISSARASVKAAQNILRRASEVKLTIVGDGPLKGIVQWLAQKFPRRVEYPGVVLRSSLLTLFESWSFFSLVFTSHLVYPLPRLFQWASPLLLTMSRRFLSCSSRGKRSPRKAILYARPL